MNNRTIRNHTELIDQRFFIAGKPIRRDIFIQIIKSSPNIYKNMIYKLLNEVKAEALLKKTGDLSSKTEEEIYEILEKL